MDSLKVEGIDSETWMRCSLAPYLIQDVGEDIWTNEPDEFAHYVQMTSQCIKDGKKNCYHLVSEGLINREEAHWINNCLGYYWGHAYGDNVDAIHVDEVLYYREKGYPEIKTKVDLLMYGMIPNKVKNQNCFTGMLCIWNFGDSEKEARRRSNFWKNYAPLVLAGSGLWEKIQETTHKKPWTLDHKIAIYNAREGSYSETWMTLREVLHARFMIKEQLDKIIDEPYPRTGDWCHDCRGKAGCHAYTAKLKKGLRREHNVEKPHYLDITPSEIRADRRIQFIKYRKQIIQYLDEVYKYEIREQLRGRGAKGYKAVRKGTGFELRRIWEPGEAIVLVQEQSEE